ncbi:hypothetical protein HYT92_00010 [Candidatus Pacearchaeota archaeon]|nr:hypothetical protein [Candidatus Pacearchaeota archaeon]
MPKKLCERIMYRVEKYLVRECPKCRHKFDKNGKDWVLYHGEIARGEKILRKTSGYIIFACKHCENMTAQVVEESFQLSSIKKAKALLKEGFVNFQECIAVGNVPERHTVHKDFSFYS